MKTTALLFSLMLAFGLQAQKVYELSQVDNAPVFAKGKMSSASFLDYYLQYPESEYKKGVEGTVSVVYIVDSTGMVSDVKVNNGITAALNEEAVRVVSLFPFYSPATKDGKNVAVKLQFPVVFKIGEQNNVVATTSNTTQTATTNDGASKNPLYVVNNKVLEEGATIDPSDIKQIRIVKGKKAIDLYGNRAKDGVVLIETE